MVQRARMSIKPIPQHLLWFRHTFVHPRCSSFLLPAYPHCYTETMASVCQITINYSLFSSLSSTWPCLWKLRRYSSASQSASPTPKRNDNSWSSTGRSAVSSLFSRTRRLGRRSSPPPPVASPTQNSRQLPSGYDSDSESDKLTPRLTSEYFKRYELMTEL